MTKQYKTFSNVLNISYDDLGHEDYYRAIIKALGPAKVRKLIPFSLEQLRASYEQDKAFNTSLTPLTVWDYASGFRTKTNTALCEHIGSPLTALYASIGVDCYSNSEGVSILKQAARDMLADTKE